METGQPAQAERQQLSSQRAPGPTFALVIDIMPVVDAPAILHQDPQHGVTLPGTQRSVRDDCPFSLQNSAPP